MPAASWYREQLDKGAFENPDVAYRIYKDKGGVKSQDNFLSWLYPGSISVSGATPSSVAGGVISSTGPSSPLALSKPGSVAPPADAPPPGFERPDTYAEFLKDSEIAQEYARIYDEAISAAKTQVAARKKELQGIANTAEAQINAIYTKWAPELEKYSKSLESMKLPGDDNERLRGLTEAAQYQRGVRAEGYGDQLDLEGQAAISQLEQEKEMRGLQLYEGHLQDQKSGSDPSVTQRHINGMVSRMKDEGLSDDDIRGEVSAFLVNQGYHPDEARGFIDSALGSGGSYAVARERALNKAEELVQYRLKEDPKNFRLNYDFFERRVMEELRRFYSDQELNQMGIDDAFLTSLYDKSMETGKNLEKTQSGRTRESSGGGDPWHKPVTDFLGSVGGAAQDVFGW